MNLEENKSCYNCKYFKAYYIKNKICFYKTCNGYCRHKDFNFKDKRKNFPYSAGCGLWEREEDVMPKRKEAIENVIKDIKKQLQEIVNVLKY